jgi:ribosome biogenesis protein BRX1
MIVKSLPVLVQIFTTPKDHRKAKPFHDHVFVFSIVDGHVWFRNYQVIYLPFFRMNFYLD